MSESAYLGKFRIIECFKKDKSFGVYLADHIYLGKNIILKTLDSTSLEDKALLERFNREAKILAQLDHPNIIKVLDFGIFENTFYISFEYFKSKTLREFIQSPNLSGEDKEKIVVQLFQALDYAHKNGIIHRDIKPENILIDDSLHLKIADFGLAHGTNESHVTNQYSIVGTPSYMSPEQIRGEKLTEQSDLFSAGITIYELYTGINPFLGKDVSQTINNLLSKEEIKLTDSFFNSDDKVKPILVSLLHKNINNRTKSAAEILLKLGNPDTNENEVSYTKSMTKSKIRFLWIPTSAAALVMILLLFTSINQKMDEPANKPQVLSKKQDSVDLIVPTQNIQNNKSATTQILNSKNLLENKGVEKNLLVEPTKKINYENLGWGKLMVECSPWADIYIDNQKKDTTPLKEEISLPAGIHLISLKHPDYPTYSFTAEIKANENSFIKVNISSLFGYLDCDIFPWGEIYLNGEFKGSTPLRNPLVLNPGEYRIDVKNPSFLPYSTKISIAKGERITLKHNFENIANNKN